MAGSPYHITATLSATPLVRWTTTPSPTHGAEFTINKRPATWTTNPTARPTATRSGPPDDRQRHDFVAADGVTATYSRAAARVAAARTTSPRP